MSVINEKPFIITVLESLTASNVATLKGLINGGEGDPVFRSLKYGSLSPLTTSDKGIKRAIIELNKDVAQQLYEGYLIYNDNYCVLIAYSSDKAQLLSLINMSLGADGLWTYEIKSCGVSTIELRSELDDLGVSESAEAIEAVKEAIAEGEIVAGTNVVANPTLVGTESNLEGVQIGDTKYGLNYLKFPTDAPAEIKVPLIATNNAQTNTGLGDKLEYDSETGKLNANCVRVMDAPSSTTLTDEQIEMTTEGLFINGDFLQLHNPILRPAWHNQSSNKYIGVIEGITSLGEYIQDWYEINGTTKIISRRNSSIINYDTTSWISNFKFSQFRGKTIPAYPSDTGTFVLKCVDGTLTWVEETTTE